MSTIDQQFVEFVVKSLVGKPDAVHIDRRIDEKGVLLELTVDPEDLGRVIGKRGGTAQSLRTLLRALGTKNEARYNLKIVDNGIGSNHHEGSEADHESMHHADSNAVAQSDTNAPTTQYAQAAPTPIAAQPSSASSDRLARTRKELEDLDDLDL